MIDSDEIQAIFRNPPVLETKRLYLRKLAKSDTDDMYEYSRQEEVTRYLLWEPHIDARYTQRYLIYLMSKYRSGVFYDWGVVYRDNDKMIGTCGFTAFHTEHNSAEIGYVLNPDYWGVGIATEAVKCVLRFGFVNLGLNRIEARYMEGNTASRRVMEKVGMKYEGTARQSMYVKGDYVTVSTCAILRSEYFGTDREGLTIN